MDDKTQKRIDAILGCNSDHDFILTSRNEDRTQGILVKWIQQVSANPLMIMVALPRGCHIGAFIHSSHAFALCRIAADDTFTRRRFDSSNDPDSQPLRGIRKNNTNTQSPILSKSLAFLDCEFISHFDIEGDHDIYIGHVRQAGILQPDEQLENVHTNNE